LNFSVRKSLVARLVSTYLVLSVLVIACVGVASWLAGRELLRDAAFSRLDTSSRQKEMELPCGWASACATLSSWAACSGERAARPRPARKSFRPGSCTPDRK